MSAEDKLLIGIIAGCVIWIIDVLVRLTGA